MCLDIDQSIINSCDVFSNYFHYQISCVDYKIKTFCQDACASVNLYGAFTKKQCEK